MAYGLIIHRRGSSVDWTLPVHLPVVSQKRRIRSPYAHRSWTRLSWESSHRRDRCAEQYPFWLHRNESSHHGGRCL